MSADSDTEDYWIAQSGTANSVSTPGLSVRTLENVEPLNAQLGVRAPLTVPVVLHDALFGQPDPTKAALAAVNGDTSKLPLLQTYAILDAAKVNDLPEVLETCGLEHRCLFKGDAFDALKDVAPWVVRLEEANSFTRNLFTRSDMPWHMWDSEPGIYLRAQGTLDDIWKHFRKFTKVQDETGKWFYFRFWEPNAFAQLLEHAQMARLLTPPETFVIHSVCAPTQDVTYVVMAPEEGLDAVEPLKLTHVHRLSFDAAVETRFARDFAKALADTVPNRISLLGLTRSGPITTMIADITGYLKPLGFAKRSDLGRIASCAMFYGTHFLHDPRIAALSRHHLTNTNFVPGLRAKRFEEALHKTLPLSAIAGANGMATVLAQIKSVFQAQTSTDDGLSRICTPEFGFHDEGTIRDFVQTCQERQDARSVMTANRQAAHFFLSVLYTPYFLDDPLHEELTTIWQEAADFEETLVQELERRCAILERT